MSISEFSLYHSLGPLLFFYSIWKLSRRRRFSSQPLEPITESELEELRGSIQGCTGRLASL
ncbi:BQ2448_4333 [Microbotryum intermedium]|uniref:BQ2448_4333 protein n=1 Tax=Microbotryum intermedium TaxID=269621 RepID=A0A238FNY1_9BASI|nr:BQ2448_4333 [Microbotryum intermedium]